MKFVVGSKLKLVKFGLPPEFRLQPQIHTTLQCGVGLHHGVAAHRLHLFASRFSCS
jgi:hypothetical protein